jgi:hypothetical protein
MYRDSDHRSYLNTLNAIRTKNVLNVTAESVGLRPLHTLPRVIMMEPETIASLLSALRAMQARLWQENEEGKQFGHKLRCSGGRL